MAKIRLTVHLTISILFLISIPNLLYSSDSSVHSIYSIKLENFSSKVYSENTSVYRMYSEDSEFNLPDTPFQNVIKKGFENNRYNIILKSGEFNLNSIDPREQYLENTRFLNIDDPKVISIKAQFEKSKNKILDVEKFVYNYIRNKRIGIPLVSAKYILENKTGDCTEHSILSIALLRALGLPARAVVGMLLTEEFMGEKNIFVYHMWAEAYTAGKWHLVDATRPGKKYHNRYIAFSYHHLKTEMPLDYLKAVSAMKSFSVEYLAQP